MEKNKIILCLALAGFLSLGGIMAQEPKVEAYMIDADGAGGGMLGISLTDEMTVMGLQLELFLPEGMALAADSPVELGSSLASHTLRLHDYSDGHYLILAYNLRLEAATATANEELLRCRFLLSPDMSPGEYPLTVSGIKLAKDALHAVCPMPYEGCLCLDESGATAVGLPGQSLAAPAIYDLGGRRQAVPRRGVNIVGDRKVLKK